MDHFVINNFKNVNKGGYFPHCSRTVISYHFYNTAYLKNDNVCGLNSLKFFTVLRGSRHQNASHPARL